MCSHILLLYNKDNEHVPVKQTRIYLYRVPDEVGLDDRAERGVHVTRAMTPTLHSGSPTIIYPIHT